MTEAQEQGEVSSCVSSEMFYTKTCLLECCFCKCYVINCDYRPLKHLCILKLELNWRVFSVVFKVMSAGIDNVGRCR